MCYRREKSETPVEKSLCSPIGRNNSLRSQLEYMNTQRLSKLELPKVLEPSKWNNPLANHLEYMNTQRASKPKLPKVLEPSKLQLPMDFTKSCLC